LFGRIPPPKDLMIVLELLLNTVASQDLETAGCILSCLLEKRDLNRVRTELLESGRKEKMLVDMQIIENIKEFLRYHKKPKGGTVPSILTAAVEAVETAIMFPSRKSLTPVKRIIESIGYSHGRPDARLLKIQEQTVNMINDGRQFKPSGRVTREDSYIDEAAQCITNYCHSDESSRTDTNSYRVYKIRNPADRKDVIRKCEQRVWNEVTWKNRFEAFLKSLAYAKFL
jgi:hypothetical protein